MTYRAVGSGTGQAEFVGQAEDSYKSYNHFGSGDIPMTAENYKTLTDNGRTMLHVPFAIGAVSFFHSVPGLDMGHNKLNLTGCLLAQIFQLNITTWSDPGEADVAMMKRCQALPFPIASRLIRFSSLFLFSFNDIRESLEIN